MSEKSTGLIPITSRIFRASSIYNSLSNVDLNLQYFDQNLQDPTLLGFRLEFGNWGTSLKPSTQIYANQYYTNVNNSGYDELPLGLKFSTDYETSSANQIQYYDARTWLYNRGEDLRCDYLNTFINGMLQLTSQMPFVFTQISGIKDLLKVDATKGQRLQKDTKITIKCNEHIDLKITTLKELYKKAAWDDVYQRWVLPDIMRYFKMIIYISDFRWFHSGANLSDDINDALPLIALECSPCEFDIGEGELPSDIKNDNPDVFSDTSFVVNVKNINIWNSNKAFNNIENLLIGDAITGQEISNGFSNFGYRQYLVRKFFLTELNGNTDTNDIPYKSDNTESKLGLNKNITIAQDNGNVFDKQKLPKTKNEAIEQREEKLAEARRIISNSDFRIDTNAYDEYRSSLDYLGARQLVSLAQQDFARRSENYGGLRNGFYYEPITGETPNYDLLNVELVQNGSINNELKKTPLYGVYVSLDDLTDKLTTLLEYQQNPAGSLLTNDIINTSLIENELPENQPFVTLANNAQYNYKLINTSIDDNYEPTSLLDIGYPPDSSLRFRLKRPLLEKTKSLLSNVLYDNSSLYVDENMKTLDTNTVSNIQYDTNSSISLKVKSIDKVLDDSSIYDISINGGSLDINSSINYSLIPIELEQALYEAGINEATSLLNTIKLNIDVLDSSISANSPKFAMKEFVLEQAISRLKRMIDLKLDETSYADRSLKDVELESANYNVDLKNVELEQSTNNTQIKDVKLNNDTPINTNIKNIEIETSDNGFSNIKNVNLETPVNSISDIKDVELSTIQSSLDVIKEVSIDVNSGQSLNQQILKDVQIDTSNENIIANQKIKDIELEETTRITSVKSINLETPVKSTSTIKNINLEENNKEGLATSKLKDVEIDKNNKEGLNTQKIKDVQLEEKSYNYKLKDVELETQPSKLSSKLN